MALDFYCIERIAFQYEVDPARCSVFICEGNLRVKMVQSLKSQEWYEDLLDEEPLSIVLIFLVRILRPEIVLSEVILNGQIPWEHLGWTIRCP